VPSLARCYTRGKLAPQAGLPIERETLETLRLKLSKKVFAGVRKALKKRKKVRAKITVTAKDSAGNATKKAVTISLKR